MKSNKFFEKKCAGIFKSLFKHTAKHVNIVRGFWPTGPQEFCRLQKTDRRVERCTRKILQPSPLEVILSWQPEAQGLLGRGTPRRHETSRAESFYFLLKVKILVSHPRELTLSCLLTCSTLNSSFFNSLQLYSNDWRGVSLEMPLHFWA